MKKKINLLSAIFALQDSQINQTAQVKQSAYGLHNKKNCSHFPNTVRTAMTNNFLVYPTEAALKFFFDLSDRDGSEIKIFDLSN